MGFGSLFPASFSLFAGDGTGAGGGAAMAAGGRGMERFIETMGPSII